MTAIELTAERLANAITETAYSRNTVAGAKEVALRVLRDLGWKELEKAAVDAERYLGHTNPEAGARTNYERAVERLRSALAKLRWQEVEQVKESVK